MSRKGKGNISLDRKAEMVAALPALGSQTAVAERFGVTRPVVSLASRDERVLKLLPEKLQEIGAGFASLTERLLARYNEIADEADLSNKGSTLLGIAAEKALLYAGLPTQITEARNDSALRAEALALLDQYLQAVAGDRPRALALLAEDAPSLARLVETP